MMAAICKSHLKFNKNDRRPPPSVSRRRFGYDRRWVNKLAPIPIYGTPSFMPSFAGIRASASVG